ncbi:MAG: anti-sigma factor [Brevundimonas sp.]|uniref:anti-sigma factor n=1 Tax=Brevundimonas sp. TaxID=1871086 RepID=UPI001A1EBA6E|nr:anti-sigma factor [Brevundimonas sp.]MBJ7446158.1 anti-sigma factor [Brevundimonas sp.]
MTDHDLTPDEQLAAEYVVGVLTSEERAQAERRIAAEPAFAAEVADWQERLMPLLAEIEPETPPRVVWMRVAAQLGVSTTRPAGVWNSVAVWRGVAAVASLAAAVAVAALVLTPPRVVTVPGQVPGAAPVLTSIALLKEEAGPTSFVVTLDKAHDRLIVATVAGQAQADRSFELWVLPEGQAPVSLGVLNGREALVLDTAKLLGPDGETASLAITLEPLGGSPSGDPTGPVVASGALTPV